MTTTTRRGAGSVAVSVDVTGVRDVLRALNKCDRDVADGIRDESGRIAAGLVDGWKTAARGGYAPPVARRVAMSARVVRDRVPAAQVGGSRKVGRSYGGKKRADGSRSPRVRASAGALLWGSEYGSVGAGEDDKTGRPMGAGRFGRPENRAGYWIAPTVTEWSRTAFARWSRVVDAAVRGYGRG